MTTSTRKAATPPATAANTSNNDSVILFTNGIGAFERVFKLNDGDKPTPISLLFPTKSLGDVIGSMKILDGVEQVCPPSYSPKREKPALELDPTNITKGLFKLSGAEIEYALKGSGAGKKKAVLMGGETRSMVYEGNLACNVDYLMVCGDKDSPGIQYLAVNGPNPDITGYNFTCDKVRGEISRSLAYNLESLKPNSTPVDLLLKPKAGTTFARIRYAAPTPAWKWTYRAIETAKGGVTLLCYAVVDNDSDDDWNDYTVRCATGQPITFSTDLAEIRIPNRGHVKLIADRAAGAVEVQAGLESGRQHQNSTRAKSAARGMGGSRELEAAPSAACSFGPNATADDECLESVIATMPVAEAADLGDESCFTCAGRNTIKAHKSGLLFLFPLALKTAKPVYFYDLTQNTERPMRALAMKNEPEAWEGIGCPPSSLGRGSCEMEQSGMHSGMAILTDSKPGEQSMLCYSVGMAVRVLTSTTKQSQRCTQHKLDKGVLVSQFSINQTTTYKVKNLGDEEEFYFNHHRAIPNSTINCVGGSFVENMAGGIGRCKANLLKSDDPQEITVNEEFVKVQRLENDGVYDWIERNPESPLLKEEQMTELANTCKAIKTVRDEIATDEAKVKTLKEEQERCRTNLTAIKGGGDRPKFETRIATSEDEINELEKTTLPGKRDRLKQLTEKRDGLMPSRTCLWTEKKTTAK